MRKFIPALLLTATIPALAIAAPAGKGPQGGPGFGPHCEGSGHHARDGFGPNIAKHDNHGMAGANFTPEQRKKMGDIMREQAKKRSDIQQKYYNKLSDADKKAFEAELKQSREDARKEMRAVLTPEQQKRFDENQKRHEERKKEWQEFQQWKASKTGK